MTRTIETQVAVVGAGPGGMAAAIEVARAGGRVVVFDEAAQPGGQIFRQAPAGFSAREHPLLASPNHARGHQLRHQLEQLKVETTQGAVVWNVTPRALDVEVDGEPARCTFQQLVLAPGAYDRCVPFPGWTLPGVITAGAAQVLVRGYHVKPGTRALVAGSGPLLLPTVAALAAAGVKVVAALEANSWWRASGALRGLAKSPMRRREAWHYARLVAGQRVSYRLGWTIFAALGDDQVRGARMGRVERDGTPLPETVREIAVDLICTGFGLCPSIELAGLLGCQMHEIPVRGGWVPRHDSWQRTSLPHVLVAGEIAGIGGADVAIAEGRVAGLAASAALGLGEPQARDAALRQAQHEAARERAASDALLAAFPVLPGLHQLADPDTIVCRCEDVKLRDVTDGVMIHGGDLRSVKMATRAGMGPCQGRVCQPILTDLLTQRFKARAPSGPPVVQVPVKPVAVSTMLGQSRG